MLCEFQLNITKKGTGCFKGFINFKEGEKSFCGVAFEKSTIVGLSIRHELLQKHRSKHSTFLGQFRASRNPSNNRKM